MKRLCDCHPPEYCTCHRRRLGRIRGPYTFPKLHGCMPKACKCKAERGMKDRIIYSTISYNLTAAYKVIIFKLKVSQLNNREVGGGEVLGHWGGNSWAGGIGLSLTPAHSELPPPCNPPNPIPPAHEFPPHWTWNLSNVELGNS